MLVIQIHMGYILVDENKLTYMIYDMKQGLYSQWHKSCWHITKTLDTTSEA